MEGTAQLHVYIETNCARCRRAKQLAREVQEEFGAAISVRVIDLASVPDRPESVFAVPTFLLNGRVLSLGNPRAEKLRTEIEALLSQGDAVD